MAGACFNLLCNILLRCVLNIFLNFKRNNECIVFTVIYNIFCVTENALNLNNRYDSWFSTKFLS